MAITGSLVQLYKLQPASPMAHIRPLFVTWPELMAKAIWPVPGLKRLLFHLLVRAVLFKIEANLGAVCTYLRPI